MTREKLVTPLWPKSSLQPIDYGWHSKPCLLNARSFHLLCIALLSFHGLRPLSPSALLSLEVVLMRMPRAHTLHFIFSCCHFNYWASPKTRERKRGNSLLPTFSSWVFHRDSNQASTKHEGEPFGWLLLTCGPEAEHYLPNQRLLLCSLRLPVQPESFSTKVFLILNTWNSHFILSRSSQINTSIEKAGQHTWMVPLKICITALFSECPLTLSDKGGLSDNGRVDDHYKQCIGPKPADPEVGDTSHRVKRENEG